MATRSIIKATAVALLAFAPTKAESGSDTAARMQTLEQQIAVLSQNVRALQPAPPATSKAAAPFPSIRSRDDEPRGGSEEVKTAPGQLDCEEGYHPEESEFGTLCAPNRDARVNVIPPLSRPDVHSYGTRGNQAGFNAPNGISSTRSSNAPQDDNEDPKPLQTSREIMSELLSEALGQPIGLDSKGKVSLSIEGTSVNIMVPTRGSKYYIYTHVGSFTGISAPEQDSVTKKVAETHNINQDDLRVNPETEVVSFTLAFDIATHAEENPSDMLDKLEIFADLAGHLQDSLEDELE